MNNPQILDCGHAPSDHSPNTTGYGIDAEGKKHCYQCCAARELREMIATGRATLYLTERTQPEQLPGPAMARGLVTRYQLKDWPGVLCFPVYGRVKHSQGYGFGRRYPVNTGQFIGPDGFIWSFRNAGDMQLACCKRTKVKY